MTTPKIIKLAYVDLQQISERVIVAGEKRVGLEMPHAVYIQITPGSAPGRFDACPAMDKNNLNLAVMLVSRDDVHYIDFMNGRRHFYCDDAEHLLRAAMDHLTREPLRWESVGR